MKYYAIKRPDGSWIMESCSKSIEGAWIRAGDCVLRAAMSQDGCRCVEVVGFVEVEK